MSPDLPFLNEGERLPVDLRGDDLEGAPRDLDRYLVEHERTLLYFYPFDDREDPPAGWMYLTEHARDLEEKRIGVVAIAGPAEARRKAVRYLEDTPFPVLEDHNYRLGQATGIMGGDEGDDVTRTTPPRAVVALDAEGRVLGARRGDDADAIRDLLGHSL